MGEESARERERDRRRRKKKRRDRVEQHWWTFDDLNLFRWSACIASSSNLSFWLLIVKQTIYSPIWPSLARPMVIRSINVSKLAMHVRVPVCRGTWRFSPIFSDIHERKVRSNSTWFARTSIIGQCRCGLRTGSIRATVQYPLFKVIEIFLMQCLYTDLFTLTHT